MNSSIIVRRLKQNDIELFQETVRVLKPSVSRHTCGTHARAWLARSSNVLVAATKKDVPVGFALGYLLDRIDSANPMLFFYEIEVAESFRQCGIGRCLVEAMKQVAKDARVVKMWVQTDPGNSVAQALYRKTGGHEAATSDSLYTWTDHALTDEDVS